MKAKCRVCGKTAQGLYGWKAKGALVKADLCAEHARELRSKTGVAVLRSYRSSVLRPMKKVHTSKSLISRKEAVTLSRPKLMPDTTPDFMAPAWASCLHWAIGEQKIRAAFTKDTGHQWMPPRNGLERMIDEAAGADRAVVEAFVAWFNERIWGDLDEKIDMIREGVP